MFSFVTREMGPTFNHSLHFKPLKYFNFIRNKLFVTPSGVISNEMSNMLRQKVLIINIELVASGTAVG